MQMCVEYCNIPIKSNTNSPNKKGEASAEIASVIRELVNTDFLHLSIAMRI